MNVCLSLLSSADKHPDKTFLVDLDGTHYSYSQVVSAARSFAFYLADNNVRPGDRVVLSFPNSVDYLTAYLGTLLRGAIAVLVDYQSRPEHLEFVKNDSGAKFWLSAELRQAFAQLGDFLPFPNELDQIAELEESLLCPKEAEQALIIYTSGTTGTPKGVQLSHANLIFSRDSIAAWAEVNSEDKELTALSLTHLFGLAHLHVYWTMGGTVYLREKFRDYPGLLETIDTEGITSFPGTPASFSILLDSHYDALVKKAAGLRYIVINSAPLPAERAKQLLEALPNTKIYVYYGLTEASRSTCFCLNSYPDKLESVGRPWQGAEVKTDPQSGEILVKGPHLTKGYWGMDSSEYFSDAWFRTGDIGELDKDGFLVWKGRTKEQINIDGLKVVPAEIEKVLLEHPRVLECAAVAIPDKFSGEAVGAFAVVESGTQDKLELELRKHCKKFLEVYKIPKKIFFIDSLPKTDTGKLKRLQLKTMVEQWVKK